MNAESKRTPTAPQNTRRVRAWVSRPDFLYSAGLLVAALGALALAFRYAPPPAGAVAWGGLVFFFGYGLFTIAAGYDHPRVGYVSFDRVAQVASILVLGPVPAACVNGLASLVFPLARLRAGVAPARVVIASMNNAGLMTLMVLGAGLLYQALGGPVPLLRLELQTVALLALLIGCMQVLNEAGLAVHLYLRDGRRVRQLSGFVIGLEFAAGGAAVLLALVLNRLELSVAVLLLFVLSAAMLALAQFARMRVALEAIVEERTRELREQTRELEQLATRDQLTGLFNRRYADTYLAGRIEEFNRYGRGFAIALADIDHFKRINDTHSHEAGDAVLRRVARMLLDRCRASDVVARYGGEEFLFCFPEADREAVVGICEELRRAVAAADWAALGLDEPVSLSAGVAEMRPGMRRSDLVRAADRKLYAAKNAGRNLVLS